MDIDLARTLVDAHHPVIVEIRLLDGAAKDRDFLGETADKASLMPPFICVRIPSGLTAKPLSIAPVTLSTRRSRLSETRTSTTWAA